MPTVGQIFSAGHLRRCDRCTDPCIWPLRWPRCCNFLGPGNLLFNPGLRSKLPSAELRAAMSVWGFQPSFQPPAPSTRSLLEDDRNLDLIPQSSHPLSCKGLYNKFLEFGRACRRQQIRSLDVEKDFDNRFHKAQAALRRDVAHVGRKDRT